MKDKQIQQLFDNYADGLQSATDLASKARSQMSSRTKSRVAWWKPFVTACCCLLVTVVLGVLVIPPMIVSPQSNEPYSVYASDEVRGKVFSQKAAEEFIPLEKVKSSNYTLTEEKYYAFYFKDGGEIAYVKAIFGFSTENGIVEVVVIAETDGFIRSDLAAFYGRYINDSQVYTAIGATSDQGEYVTNAFFNASGIHLYISAQGNFKTVEDAVRIVDMFSLQGENF